MTETPNNNGNTSNEPTQELLAAFEHLPADRKVDLFEEAMCLMSDDLGRLNDPVLDRELDILDAIHTNIRTRLEELEQIYGIR